MDPEGLEEEEEPCFEEECLDEECFEEECSFDEECLEEECFDEECFEEECPSPDGLVAEAFGVASGSAPPFLSSSRSSA